ncbi:TIGR01777 family oxidoreductase [Listeria sp. PSOL-1]|uniref:TIGR01777 family oxidoreductase n=1 Tax=Listeria sp. PSOL-1 TaxID=1844999 RepID=UPI0013CFF8CB|nr:TIGR01777 family oxidoreductase [Listeria sp. PSOL-1]
MNILLAGGTGFIGSEMVHEFEKWADEIYILTRSPKKDYANVHYLEWLTEDVPLADLRHLAIDVVINLAGAGLMEGRWGRARKQLIVSSRIEATSALISMIRRLDKKPELFINASAIGIYPASKSAVYLDTEMSNKDYHFLGRTAIEWEKTAQELEKYDIRVVYARFGLILGTTGGAFPLFEKTFQSFLGGRFGSGNQWYSWIHIADIVRATEFVIHHKELSGGINFTAPHPVQQKKFAEQLGKKLHRPYKVIIPKQLIKIALGEKAVLITKGQRVYPAKLISNHFDFQFDTLDKALEDLK